MGLQGTAGNTGAQGAQGYTGPAGSSAGSASTWSQYPATQNVDMSNFSLINWAGGNSTGQITVSNSTNNLTLGNFSGITMTATFGNININNSSGATVISNSADAINLTTSSNDIILTSGNNINITTNNATGTLPGAAILSLIDMSPTSTGALGSILFSISNGTVVASAGKPGVFVYDFYGATDGNGIVIQSLFNDITLTSGSNINLNTASNINLTADTGISLSSNVTITNGLTINNGFRPLYALVTGTSLTTGTTPAITNTNYGTYFNITNSGFNALTLPTSTYSTDSNAFWVLRNNTSSYLSITTTYTGTGGGGSGSLVIPPANSTTIMFTSNTSGSDAYTFF
jgi:hypothetical protein